MSDDYLKIIPTSPDQVPPKKAHKPAVSLLKSFFPDGEECQAEVYEAIEFIDQGENIEAVICPACRKRSELDHLSEDDPVVAWWCELSDAICESALETLSTTMSCCGRDVRVMDLEFDWPAGIARFELSVMNPDSTENLTASQLGELETILGCGLRQIRAHY